jgi:hypothetical protein
MISPRTIFNVSQPMSACARLCAGFDVAAKQTAVGFNALGFHNSGLAYVNPSRYRNDSLGSPH